jgi:hypothetical protein
MCPSLSSESATRQDYKVITSGVAKHTAVKCRTNKRQLQPERTYANVAGTLFYFFTHLRIDMFLWFI